jgi:hypothetical protein
MKRFVLLVCATLGLLCSNGAARADWGSLCYGGYQPWWNIFACRSKCLTCEEERLQRFWHDYYDALRNYYCALDHIDWVAYYKNHGYQINAGACGGGPCGGPGCGGCCPRVNYAPVFVSPCMQWAVPNSCCSGAPAGPGCGGGPAMPMGCPGGACGGGGAPYGY